jgi:hypothetical protein
MDKGGPDAPLNLKGVRFRSHMEPEQGSFIVRALDVAHFVE